MNIFESVWCKIHKETQILVLRGETSDILLPETVEQMKNTGPGLYEAVTIPKVGHAPMLFSSDQTKYIRDFFAK